MLTQTNPRKNTVYVFNSFFFFLAILEATGGISLTSGASTSCCAYILHCSPFSYSITLGTAPTITVHHTEASVHGGPGLHGEQGGSPKQIPQ